MMLRTEPMMGLFTELFEHTLYRSFINYVYEAMQIYGNDTSSQTN